jgi:hypothetical protein
LQKADETTTAWAKRELALRKQERKAAEDAAAHATQVVGAVGDHESNKKTTSH